MLKIKEGTLLANLTTFNIGGEARYFCEAKNTKELKEAYDQGRLDMYNEQVDDTLDNILFNTKRNINIEKKKLQEKNFYNKPSEEDVIKMRAYEYLNENLGEIIKNYKEN